MSENSALKKKISCFAIAESDLCKEKIEIITTKRTANAKDLHISHLTNDLRNDTNIKNTVLNMETGELKQKLEKLAV